MGIEGSTSIAIGVLNPELRGLMVRLRLSRNNDQVFFANNEDFLESSGETGVSIGFSDTI